jgi:RsiW-degrading membrane proteinase PrsW (M82 family)
MTWTAGPDGGAGHPPPAALAPGALVLPAVPPAVTRKHGVRGVLFTVGVIVALLAGAAVMGLVMVASGRPDAIAIGFVLAALPVGPLVACYLWLDRYEPEPVLFLVTAFLWGALVATAGALVLQAADQTINGSDEIWSAVVIAPITEEAGKGIFVLLLLWSRRHVVDGILDGLVYAGLVGVGFAFTENILYFAGAYTGGPDLGPGGLGSATVLFVLRGIFSPFAHPLFTSAIGIGAGLMVSSRSRVVRVVAPIAGYVVAVLLHAAWNGSAFLYDGSYFLLTYLVAMVPGFAALVGLALWARYREGVLLTRSLTDLAWRGYLAPQEVPWLVQPSARRTAQRNAARHGGPALKRYVREYQQQAIELAALHDRVMRGSAPGDSARRGTLMAQRLAVLRQPLLRPTPAPARPAAPPPPGPWPGLAPPAPAPPREWS